MFLRPWKGPNIPWSIQQSFNVINDLSDDKGTPQHIKQRLRRRPHTEIAIHYRKD